MEEQPDLEAQHDGSEDDGADGHEPPPGAHPLLLTPEHIADGILVVPILPEADNPQEPAVEFSHLISSSSEPCSPCRQPSLPAHPDSQ
ncbi:hypothetical protein ES703_60516 [subsurface metagenome]